MQILHKRSPNSKHLPLEHQADGKTTNNQNTYKLKKSKPNLNATIFHTSWSHPCIKQDYSGNFSEEKRGHPGEDSLKITATERNSIIDVKILEKKCGFSEDWAWGAGD